MLRVLSVDSHGDEMLKIQIRRLPSLELMKVQWGCNLYWEVDNQMGKQTDKETDQL